MDFEILAKNLWLCSARRDWGYHYSKVLIVVLQLQVGGGDSATGRFVSYDASFN